MALTGVLRPGHVVIRVLELEPALKHYKDVLGLIETGRDDKGPRLPQGVGRTRPPQRGPAQADEGRHGHHGLEGRFPGDAEEARRRHRNPAWPPTRDGSPRASSQDRRALPPRPPPAT